MTNVIRTINEIELYEMSLVTNPLWPSTQFGPGFKIIDRADGREVHTTREVE